MESTKEKSGLLHQILPPRLEDAGLEDPALPPDSIHEAFLKAAAAVKSSAASIFSSDADHGGCVIDPWPTAKDASDEVVGIQPKNEPPGSCTVERGFEAVTDEVKVVAASVGDDVVVEGGEKLGEDREACVDELRDLDIEDVKKGGEVGKEEEEEEKTRNLPWLKVMREKGSNFQAFWVWFFLILLFTHIVVL